MTHTVYKTLCHLVNALAESDKELLWPHFQRIFIRNGQVVYQSGADINYVYFVESGIGAIVLPQEHLEIAMIGNEGFIGVPAILGSDRSLPDVVMKVGGQASLARGLPSSPSGQPGRMK